MKENINLFTEQTMRDMGKRIQEERKNKGFKAIDFADIIGIGKDQLSRIETGKVACKIDYLFVMSKILNVTSDYLLYGGNFSSDEFAIRQFVTKMPLETRKKAIMLLKILSE